MSEINSISLGRDPVEKLANLFVQGRICATPSLFWAHVKRTIGGDLTVSIGKPRSGYVSWRYIEEATEVLARYYQKDDLMPCDNALDWQLGIVGMALRSALPQVRKRRSHKQATDWNCLTHCRLCFRFCPHPSTSRYFSELCEEHRARAVNTTTGKTGNNPRYYQGLRLQPEFNKEWRRVRSESRQAFIDPLLIRGDFNRWLRRYYPQIRKRYSFVHSLADLLRLSDGQEDKNGSRARLHAQITLDPELGRSYLNRLEAWESAFSKRHAKGGRGGWRPGAGRKATGPNC